MSTSIRRAALAGVVGSAIGIIGASTLAFVDPRVPDERVSYPLTAGPFRLTELLWTLSHVLVLIAVIAFVRAGVSGQSGALRVARTATLIGFATQVVAEFGYVFLAEAKVDDPGPMILSTAFGISSVLIGLGLIGLGIGTLRARVWQGWPRYAPLVWGIWSIAFIPLIVGGPFFIGIISWYAMGLLLWAAMLTAPAGTVSAHATLDRHPVERSTD